MLYYLFSNPDDCHLWESSWSHLCVSFSCARESKHLLELGFEMLVIHSASCLLFCIAELQSGYTWENRTAHRFFPQSQDQLKTPLLNNYEESARSAALNTPTNCPASSTASFQKTGATKNQFFAHLVNMPR